MNSLKQYYLYSGGSKHKANRKIWTVAWQRIYIPSTKAFYWNRVVE
jgi:hypothetical protein